MTRKKCNYIGNNVGDARPKGSRVKPFFRKKKIKVI